MPPIENTKTGLLALAITLALCTAHLLDEPSGASVDAAVAAEATAAPLDVREQARREWLEQFAEVKP